jgi:hypothetical protein
MFPKKLLVCTALAFASATAIVAAQNDVVSHGVGTTVRGSHAIMTVVAEPAPSSPTRTKLNDSGLVTIYSNLAEKYPKGEYWCCGGYNVMGPGQNAGEQWMAGAFTPHADHTVTRIEVAVGYSGQGPNGVVLSLNRDNKGVPGKPLKTWNASGLPTFGTCCGLVVKSDASGIPVSAGKRYWIVLSTNSKEKDTVDGWNFNDTNQVDAATDASFSSNKWTVFQTTQAVAFAVKGSN